jgi:hypothetical protein
MADEFLADAFRRQVRYYITADKDPRDVLVAWKDQPGISRDELAFIYTQELMADE